MKSSIVLLFLLCLFSQNLHAQDEYVFEGVIKLSGLSLYTYSIHFYEEEGVIEGYSITDQDGAYETKSLVSGSIDHKTKEIEFYESEILTVKSSKSLDGFCYIHFNGTLKEGKEQQEIWGKFNSKYKTGDLCINGVISMTNKGPVLKRKERPKVSLAGGIKQEDRIEQETRIEQENRIKRESRIKIKEKSKNLVSKANNVSINTVATNEVLHVFSKDDELSMLIYDEEVSDNDRINLSINDVPILIDYGVTKRSRKVTIPMDRDRVEVKVTALTNGIIGKNTIRFDITDSNNLTRTVTNLEVGETATLVFLKQ
ncbi:MAG: hypothetical protein KTR22_06820 [Flavobacteriaceae bacterium]|nr:hypothetical protein [Flavobacteriaceae bacterium]